MSYTKITQADLTGKGVIGLPDTPNLSTTDIQEKFDEIALDVIVPKFNDLSDELDNSGIGDAIQSADITNMRLNADMAIEVSSDEGQTWSGTASSGHRIMDGSGTIYTQESKLQFSNNVTIQDDPVNGATKILIQPGEKGDPGKAATITIGDVSAGQSASVTNVGSQTDAIFDFTLPKGDPGSAATIAVGTVTSGASASVINSGTSDAAVFNFVLPKGDQGDPGTGLTLLGTYATLADLQAAHPTGQRGNAYFVGDDTDGDVYLWDPDTTAWVNIGELRGPKGNTGATPSLSIGTVTTGSPSAVTITGTVDYPVLNFTLEQGDKGDTGNAGTIAVGTVTSGQTASVTNVGTSTAAVFDFVLPKGDKGDQGNPTVVNGKSGNNITVYGSDIELNSLDSTKVDTAINNMTSKIPAWSSAVSCLTGATTLTITDANITASSAIELFKDATTGDVNILTKTITTGQVDYTFDPLEEDVTFRVRITDTYGNQTPSAVNFSDLGDVSFQTPLDGQIAVYDGTAQKWKNQNIGLSYEWTTPVSCLTGDTSCTIQNAHIYTTSTIDPYSDPPTPYSNITVTNGQAVITFPALSQNTDIKLLIFN